MFRVHLNKDQFSCLGKERHLLGEEAGEKQIGCSWWREEMRKQLAPKGERQAFYSWSNVRSWL